MLDLLLAEGIARFFQFFGDVRPVPRLWVCNAQLLGGKLAQISHVFFCIGAGTPCQITQKVDDLLGRVGHLGHQRNLGKVSVAQQFGFFLAQGQHFLDDGRVVVLGQIAFGLIRCTGDVGVVHLFAQRRAVCKLHHRQVRRNFQGQLVAFLAIGLCSGLGGLLHVGRHAIQFFLSSVVGPAVGGVQRVFAEFLAQLGRAFLNFGKALAVCALQLRTRQHKAAQRIGMCLLLLGREGVHINGLVLGVQALIGTQIGPELCNGGQCFVVGRAQLGAVGHAGQVADRAPRGAQLFGSYVQHLGNGIPLSREVRCGDRLQCRLCAFNQSVDSRADICRRDAVKLRQAGGFKQSIGHRWHFAPKAIVSRRVGNY